MNLLPKTEKDVLKKDLKLRFTIAAMYLFSFSLLLGLAALLPAFFLIRGNLSLSESQYPVKVAEENSAKDILDLPVKIDSRLKLLQSNLTKLSVIDTLNEITNHLPEKITLDSILFSRNQEYKEKSGIHILISGTALDRDSLVSFSKLLRESNFFSSVDTPVSSLTKKKNLPFSMDLFIENQK